METRYTISGTITGKYWWPINVDAGKPARLTFRRVNHADGIYGHDEQPDLLSAMETLAIREGGDFSTAAKMTADSVLIAERSDMHGRRTFRRIVPLTAFPSIADYVTDELYGSDFFADD